MKRQSTVERLSPNKLNEIKGYMLTHKCGFLIRYKGVEYGLSIDNDGELEIDDWWFPFSSWLGGYAGKISNVMIRKGWQAKAPTPPTPREVEGELEIPQTYANSWVVWEGVKA